MEFNRIISRYNENSDRDNMEDFLDYAYEVMFKSYITKTFIETRKKYSINMKKYRDIFLLFDDMSSIDNGIDIDIDILDDINMSFIDSIEDYQLYQYLKNLSIKQRTVIIEYYVNEKSEKEIGDILKVTKQAVNSLRKRALNRK